MSVIPPGNVNTPWWLATIDWDRVTFVLEASVRRASSAFPLTSRLMVLLAIVVWTILASLIPWRATPPPPPPMPLPPVALMLRVLSAISELVSRNVDGRLVLNRDAAIAPPPAGPASPPRFDGPD